jgi:hypothetical protein
MESLGAVLTPRMAQQIVNVTSPLPACGLTQTMAAQSCEVPRGWADFISAAGGRKVIAGKFWNSGIFLAECVNFSRDDLRGDAPHGRQRLIAEGFQAIRETSLFEKEGR